MNYILSEIYAPCIKSNQSGLPYDYQIYYNGEKLTVYFYEQIIHNKIEQLHSTINSFSNIWNNDHPSEFTILATPIIKKNLAILKFCNSPPSETYILELIKSLSSIDGIKKVIFK